MNIEKYLESIIPTYIYKENRAVVGGSIDSKIFYGFFLKYEYLFYRLSDKYLLAIDCTDSQYREVIRGKLPLSYLLENDRIIRIYESEPDTYFSKHSKYIALIKKEWLLSSLEEIYTVVTKELENYIENLVNKEKTDQDPKLTVGSKKPSTAAIPPISILLLGLAMKDGEQKYGRFNWRKTKVDNSVYYDAAMRHLLSYWDGEEKAQDSKIQHLAHVMACCAILIDAHYTDSCIDTRDSTLVVPSFIDEFYKRNKQNG